jgi:hypothetical protein
MVFRYKAMGCTVLKSPLSLLAAVLFDLGTQIDKGLGFNDGAFV